jgi:MFS transporter, putative metabolite:H+ symporter
MGDRRRGLRRRRGRHGVRPAYVAWLLILCGVLITVSNTVLSYAYHAYQVEIFPVRIRARAAGLAYSSSRIGAMSSGFLIAYFLRAFGATGAFGLITACMIAVMLVIGMFGPSGRDLHGIEAAH